MPASRVLVLSEHDLIGLLPPVQIVAAVEAALRARDLGQIVAPKRLHMHWDNNTLLAMPSATQGALGIKIVSVVPGNTARGLPVTDGVMILNDDETGAPRVFMNAAALTSQRTGAVGALGVKYGTPSETVSVGIVGCGVQGAWQAIFACAVRPIREVFCVCRSSVKFEKFAMTVNRHVPEVRISPCHDVNELLARTDVVVTATTSTEPVLPDESDRLVNKHFISVGSFRPTMQELPDSVYRLAGLLAVDSEHASEEVGDVINPIRKGIISQTDVFSIAECVTGKRTLDSARTTAYKSVGSAIFDLFVAQALYREARSLGLGCQVPL
jgi:ornithine cyclodeaminase/alanine dehydrogenase-like protein (mu-crystallin family)